MTMPFREILRPMMNIQATTRRNLTNINNSEVKASISFPISFNNLIFTHKVRSKVGQANEGYFLIVYFLFCLLELILSTLIRIYNNLMKH